ncbi:MAG TPA: FKBP-type peptidyl-prolyl cis-trans isomerase [Bryobacteraceae bacterium]|jgi:FKBP-type peptidyl-prolyl cis-trans isomerase FkpA|nr:FKBP-type peptidyl-prolyl cis-trans isomerase [Bryobacteraceae bacterium]
MRAILLFLPAALLAQTPAPKPAAPAAPKPPASVTAPKPPAAAATKLTTDDDKIIYSLGLSISRSLAQFDLSPAEVEIVKQALSDAAANKPAEDLDTWGPKIQTLAGARSSRVAGREKAASAAYLTKAAAEAGAVRTDSGLVYKELTAGSGASPQATDTVKVNYRGTLTNGTEFDSSYKRNMPAEFPLNQVIHCWTEGVQKMRVGGKAQLVCPSDIAYGDQGRPPQIPGGATLVFEVELLEVAGGGAEPPK